MSLRSRRTSRSERDDTSDKFTIFRIKSPWLSITTTDPRPAVNRSSSRSSKPCKSCVLPCPYPPIMWVYSNRADKGSEKGRLEFNLQVASGINPEGRVSSKMPCFRQAAPQAECYSTFVSACQRLLDLSLDVLHSPELQDGELNPRPPPKLQRLKAHPA